MLATLERLRLRLANERAPWPLARLAHALEPRHLRLDERQLQLVVHTCGDAARLAPCLAALRQHYPGARLLVVSDGDPDPRSATLARHFGGAHLAGERLKRVGLGAAWLDRYLRAFLATDARWLVKLDPDTWAQRRARYLLDAPFFGHLLWPGTTDAHVQGGLQVLRRDLVERLVASGATLDPRYRALEGWCHDPHLRRDLARSQAERGVAQLDHVLFDMVTRRLGVPARDWGECCCAWRDPLAVPPGRFAWVHPRGGPDAAPPPEPGGPP